MRTRRRVRISITKLAQPFRKQNPERECNSGHQSVEVREYGLRLARQRRHRRSRPVARLAESGLPHSKQASFSADCSSIFRFLLLRPSILESDGAVEHRLTDFRLWIDAKIS
jgi:hypothetical protein